MRVFLDTNVLLDVFGRREPHWGSAARVWSSIEEGRHAGFVSAISFNNIYYVMRRTAGQREARRALMLMMNLFQVVALDERMIRSAMDSGMTDFEDAIQCAAAVRAKADCIVTRNVRHFPTEPIPAVAPEEFLAAREA